MSTTSFTRAWEVVNGFFIGGGGDDLHQENLTKADLARAIQGAIDEATKDANLQLDEARKLLQRVYNKARMSEALWAEVASWLRRNPGNDSLQSSESTLCPTCNGKHPEFCSACMGTGKT